MKHTNKLPILILLFSILLVGCGDGGKFKISKGKVGHITSKTTVQDLEEIFKKDSIVKNLSEGSFGNNYFQDDDEYLIYEKGGEHLLTIIPREPLDSTSTIKSVQIFDGRFETESGISLNTAFAEINMNNRVNKVETSFTSATLFLDDLNATIAIDKEELGLREFSPEKVSLEQIPDLARMKSFIIWFN